MRPVDVAEQVVGFDVVVAGVQVAVVLQGESGAAGRGVDAQRVLPEVALQGHVEQLHEHRSDVPTQPLLVDVDEELPVVRPADRALGDERPRLGVEQPLPARSCAPSPVRQRQRVRGGPFHDRDELHPPGLELVAEVPVDGRAVVLVGRVDGAQDVDVDVVAAQRRPALHHLAVGALPAPVHPIGVVDRCRAVHAARRRMTCVPPQVHPPWQAGGPHLVPLDDDMGSPIGPDLPFPPTPSASSAGRTLKDSIHRWRQDPRRLREGAPNVVILMGSRGVYHDGWFAGAFGPRCSPAWHRSPPTAARSPPGTDSTAAATDTSTRYCTPWCGSASSTRQQPATTSPAAPPKEGPTARSNAAWPATSHATCTAYSKEGPQLLDEA